MLVSIKCLGPKLLKEINAQAFIQENTVLRDRNLIKQTVEFHDKGSTVYDLTENEQCKITLVNTVKAFGNRGVLVDGM